MEEASQAEELFARFLARTEVSESGTSAGYARFAAWVRDEHPGEAEALFALRDRWLAFLPVLERQRSDDPTAAQSGEVLQRLRGREPAGGRFELREEIGAGGMGCVYRAFDPELERELALKVVRERDSDGGRATRRRNARFLAEARITGQLHHPGIVSVHELGLDDSGRVFYTMPLIEGEDLSAVFEHVRAKRPGWTLARALGFLQRVCETMAYAHRRGVVHGDLKPANVRVGSFGEVTVMDWGLARTLDATAGTESPSEANEPPENGEASPSPSVSRLAGTPAYLAPERVEDPSRPPDPRADVYAVGAMLHELLAGRAPVVGVRSEDTDGAGAPGDLDDLREMHALAPTPIHELVPDAPPELLSICARATAPLAERHADMASLGEDLRAFLEGRVVRSHATGAWVELSKWIARNRELAASLGALLVTLAVGLAVAVWLGLRAERERARVLRLSDLRRHDELVARAEELWPALPSFVPAYREWLEEADHLGTRLQDHEHTLADLRRSSHRTGDDRWVFDEDEAQWHHDTLAALVDQLSGFTDPESGITADVERRLAFADTVEERSLGSPEARAAWEEAIASIANPSECPAYDGLSVSPQLGLLPSGRDSESGLWEFAHLASGIPPERDEDGRLVLEEESGIVLVLIPGGRFRMGAQSADPDRPGYQPAAFGNEAPVHEVALEPFFLSRFELTQAQWLRATGSNPSTHSPDSGAPGLGITLLHPVETIGRGQCERTLERLALVLPTEAQWEYAARAGGDGAWWTGDDALDLSGAANLADRSVVRAGGEWPQIEPWLDDGFHRHAPVDALFPNPFGLVHVHGNVWEWCRDDFGAYDLPVRPGDGLRLVPEARLAVGRGGGYVNNAAFSRVSQRDGRPDAPHLLFGVRPARALEP